MTRKQLLTYIISFTILPIAIFSILPYPSIYTNVIKTLQNTTVWWSIQALVLFVFCLNGYYFLEKGNIKKMKVIQWYLLWNIICIFRGLFIAENYWDWKGLTGNIFVLLIPIIAYTATNKMVLKSILSFYIKYTLPLFAILALLISTDAYGFYLVPISLMMLFFPILTSPWKIIVAGFTLLVILVDFDARSNVIKFGVPVLLLFVYYFRRFITTKWIEIVRKILIVLPLLFFILGASGAFNIYDMEKYIKGNYKQAKHDAKGQIIENDLKSDTRTFLYAEVLLTAKKYNCWLMGRSPARGNISESFGDEDMTGRNERLANEVAILNVFTWTGLVGIVFYLLVFYRASYIAINKSNNIFSKILGLWIAFRWLYSWVEDVNNFSLNYFMLWLMIGLCFSKSFRDMSNKEVKHWVREIFKTPKVKSYYIKIHDIRRTIFTTETNKHLR